MAVLGLGEEVLKMNLETLVMPGRMKVLKKKKKKKRKRPTKTGVKSKGHKNQCRVSSGYIWNKIDTLLLDYNPKYKLNVHKLVHSNINK